VKVALSREINQEAAAQQRRINHTHLFQANRDLAYTHDIRAAPLGHHAKTGTNKVELTCRGSATD
jgi:hypothetical protein